MKAHLTLKNGQFTWSGYDACGDPAHKPYAMIVDIGRDFTITSKGKLYLTGAGPQQHQEFSPVGVVLAARAKMFGFKEAEEEAPKKARKSRAKAT